ncbi:MAG: endonuclease/exonuclease/phosphatase family protein [Fusobacteriaceae bacterium]|nr:endonuclease/exonuclease/phosphatase family protein [Fusobacteriaceae bacterium]
MTAVSLPFTDSVRLRAPTYYAPDDSNIEYPKKNSLPVRIFYVTLPFLALYQPFGRAITLVTETLKTFSALGNLKENKNAKELIKTAILITALVGTIFVHPAGLCISVLYDFGIDVSNIVLHLQEGNNQEAFYSLVSMCQHLFFIGTILFSSIEIIAISMLFSMAYEICRSKKEFEKGNILEGCSHVLMSLVRFSQAAPYIEKNMHKHDIVGKKISTNMVNILDKIRTKTALYFYYTSSYFLKPHWKSTELWLETVSICKDPKESYTKKAVNCFTSSLSSLVMLPFSLAGLAVAQCLHFSAYLISPTPYIHLFGNAKEQKTDDDTVVFQENICSPAGGFARMFGGVDLPNEERIKMICTMIKNSEADLVLLQEASNLEDSLLLYDNLKSDFYEFYLNIGATPFVLQNPSGLFVASKSEIYNPRVIDFSNISGTETMVNKALFSFSRHDHNYITTHASPSSDDINPTADEIFVRAQEQEIIYEECKRMHKENGKPVFVAADFNINKGSEEYKYSLLMREGENRYDGGATAETEYLIQRNWHHMEDAKRQNLILDYFLALFKNKNVSFETKKIEIFNRDIKKAVSDHAPLVTHIRC